MDVHAWRYMGDTTPVSSQVRGLQVVIAVSQRATGLITSVNDTPVDFHSLHGPQGQSEELVLELVAGGDIGRDTDVHHGFASVSESNAYGWGAGAPR